MHNNTPDDYKEAVRNKYEKEKDGIYSNYLSNPSQASLRDLCWEIFKSNKNTDDLLIYKKFFKCEFDPNNEDTSIVYTNKFKKVGGFFRRGIDPAKIDTVNFAAILVSFELRPYSKFRKVGLSEDEIENPNESESVILGEEKEKEENEENEGDEGDEDEVIEDLPINNKEPNKLSERFTKKLRSTIIATTIIFCLIATVIYFAFFKKDCMQWKGEYYERVDCVQEINSLDIKPFDEIQFSLKKIKVCDTTSFFKLGKPCVWYGKSVDGNYECFNIPSLHPETDKTLKPISQYIVDKYLLKIKKNKIKDLYYK